MSPSSGPFTIYDQFGNVIAEDVTKKALIDGINYSVDDDMLSITLKSTGNCKIQKTVHVSDITEEEYINIKLKQMVTGCIWRHLTNIQLYNSYYGVTEPYIIEYPFAYQTYDEILQNVKDYSKVYNYIPSVDGVVNETAKIEVDNQWFNKAVLYNGQQSTGILELVPKPINNLKQYLAYPIYNDFSKTITYTKSDNFYQYNTFWGLVKNKALPLFRTSCESLSIDKIVNQVNMDYGKRSFKKEPLRAKDLKVRHILDNSSEAHIVSQFIIAPAQISYK